MSGSNLFVLIVYCCFVLPLYEPFLPNVLLQSVTSLNLFMLKRQYEQNREISTLYFNAKT